VPLVSRTAVAVNDAATVNVAALLVTLVAPMLLTTTRY
jgi:hypothetical protein